MPVITFLSTKGGVGKTTAAMLLATELAEKTNVTVIDIDPNRPFSKWAKQDKTRLKLTIIDDADQDNIDQKIAEASERSAFVIIDCEGVASMLNSYAAGDSDLVIIPTQGSHLDATEAAKSIRMVRKLSRTVPFGILFTRTSPAVRTRTLAAIQEQFHEQGVPTFATHLHERDAFRAVFSFGKSLAELDASEVPNTAKSLNNAREMAVEIIEVIRRIGQGEEPFKIPETRA